MLCDSLGNESVRQYVSTGFLPDDLGVGVLLLNCEQEYILVMDIKGSDHSDNHW